MVDQKQRYCLLISGEVILYCRLGNRPLTWGLKILIILLSLICGVICNLVSLYVDKHTLRVLTLLLQIVFSKFKAKFSSVQFSSVAHSCPTLCDPMNRSTPGLPVHHQLPEFTQTHIHRVGDAIQPSHPLSSPSLPAPNSSQHQSLFQ